MPTTGLPCFQPTARTSAAIQAAIDSASAAGGGIVYLLAGADYDISTPIKIPGSTVTGVADAGVRLWGAGPNGTILAPSAPTTSSDVARLAIEASFADVAGVFLRGFDETDVAPQVTFGTTAAHPIRRARLSNSRVEIADTVGVRFRAGTTTAAATSDCSIDNSEILGNEEVDETLVDFATNTVRPRLRQTRILNYGGVALSLLQTQSVTCESVVLSSQGTEENSAVQVSNSQNGLFSQVWLEEVEAFNYFFLLLPGSGGWTMETCTFRRSGATGTEPRAVALGGTTSGTPCTLMLATHVSVAGGAPTSGAEGHVYSATSDSATVATELSLLGGVACGPDPTDAYPLIAKLSSTRSPFLSGTTRLRIPTVSGTSGISNPLKGDLVLDRSQSASSQLKMYRAGQWRTVHVSTTPP